MNRRNFIASIVGGVAAALCAPFAKAEEPTGYWRLVSYETKPLSPAECEVYVEFVNDSIWKVPRTLQYKNFHQKWFGF